MPGRIPKREGPGRVEEFGYKSLVQARDKRAKRFEEEEDEGYNLKENALD